MTVSGKPATGAQASQGSLTRGDELDVVLHGMAHGGEGVGRSESGQVVFVEGGLPGETARVTVETAQQRFARGLLTGISGESSPARIADPRCPHFGTWPARGVAPTRWCGACRWQHVSYDAQLEFKTATLRDAFVRLAKIPEPAILPAVGMPDPWAYRNHLRVRMTPDGVGYHGLDPNGLVTITECPIAHPLVAELLPMVVGSLPVGSEVSLRAGIATGDQLVVLHAEAADYEAVEVDVAVSVVLESDGAVHAVAGTPQITEMLGGHPFVIPATAFFQVNTVMADALVGLLRESLRPVGLLVDLHSGVGTFAVLLSDLAEQVISVEIDPVAVAAAVENAAGLDHLTLLEADAAEGLAFVGTRPDAVVVDPPRAGLDREVVRLLTEIAPDTIAYVSCDPATLARDAHLLISGGYALESSRVVDMFPQTFHVESLSLFRRAG
jgi:23S rRNA (uracil1939-C5)-methyltransferase